MATRKLQLEDRVKRINQTGCSGTVKDLRHETTNSGPETKEKPIMVVVHWDNGTQSYFTPEGLELVSA